MQMSLRTVVAALAVAALTPQHLTAQAPAPPIVKPSELRKVSDHVQIIPDDSVQLVPNVGFVVGDKAVLVIDTGMGPRNGAAVSEVAQKLSGGTRAVYLVPTHFHPEHDLGAQAFPATTKLIRSDDEQKDIAEFGLQLAKVFASRGPIFAELLEGADYRKPDITFAQSYDLDLGGVQAHLIALGANHTRGDTAIWIEPDRVLFAGDVAMKGQPAFASPYSTIHQWLASLDRLEALKPVRSCRATVRPAMPASSPGIVPISPTSAREPPRRSMPATAPTRPWTPSPPRFQTTRIVPASPARSGRLTPKRPRERFGLD
jgi:glyoxylase-like metal-dependent hydrolase (beta-lactamase superfamily II)